MSNPLTRLKYFSFELISIENFLLKIFIIELNSKEIYFIGVSPE